MTTKVSFYILNQPSLKERDLYSCRIIEKLYNHNHKIYIHTNGPEEAQNFETQLWTFSDISFVPHEIYNQNIKPNAPISIGFGTVPIEQNDTLINLTPDIPCYQQFKQLIEVIPSDDSLKEFGRTRFQTYKKEGCQIEVFYV